MHGRQAGGRADRGEPARDEGAELRGSRTPRSSVRPAGRPGWRAMRRRSWQATSTSTLLGRSRSTSSRATPRPGPGSTTSSRAAPRPARTTAGHPNGGGSGNWRSPTMRRSRWRSRDLRGCARRLSVLERYAYLNAGSVGPLAQRTHDALAAAERDELVHGRATWRYLERMLEARGGCAQLSPQRSVSSRADVADDVDDGGVPDRARRTGARARRRDRHHRRRALRAARPRAPLGSPGSGCRLRDRPAAESLEAILAEVGPRTKLVAVSHVLWVNGHVLPMDELRDAVSVPILVDGAQSVGAIPVDAAPFDFYTVSGQKWLCGPAPSGGLYVKDPTGSASLCPVISRRRSTSPTAASIRATGAAVRPGVDPGAVPRSAARRARRASRMAVRALATDGGALRELLLELGCDVVTEPGHSNLVSWRWEGDTHAAALALGEDGVLIRDLLEPGSFAPRAATGRARGSHSSGGVLGGLFG